MAQFDIQDYDRYIVSFSGGKDSTATFLYLLDHGIPREKIELWHQDIDGRERNFFDWEVTPDYCRRFAHAFGVKIYFQWKEGGFYREMMRKNRLTAPNCYELPDGTIGRSGGTRGTPNTRLRFPQAAADLRTRWCSSYLKIDVCSAAIVNQSRFNNIQTLILSGERGEESPQRAKYAIWEPDRADCRNGKHHRHVDRHRPIRDWTEAQVWEIIKRYRVRAHPCYYMGWSRCSCRFCIFGNKNQFASASAISPERIQEIALLEQQFGCTIKRKCDILSFIRTGTPYHHITEAWKTIATCRLYILPVILPDDEQWELPAGAFGEQCGPV